MDVTLPLKNVRRTTDDVDMLDNMLERMGEVYRAQYGGRMIVSKSIEGYRVCRALSNYRFLRSESVFAKTLAYNLQALC